MVSAESIEHSPAFRKWRDAFRSATGMDIFLLGTANLDLDLRRAAETAALCRLLCSRSRRCAACRSRFANRLRTRGTHHPGLFAMRCFAGLTVTAMPLALADGSTAFLYTSPTILRFKGRTAAVEKVAERINRNGASLPRALVDKLARDIPVRDLRKFNATLTLLRLLAEQLCHLSRQMLEAPDQHWHDGFVVKRSCELIDLRFTEDLHLDDVGRDVGVSRSYLSHLFVRHVGLSFTDYLASRRVIELKRLLGDSGLSVTEAMFAAGFQSVSQANRVFRAATGMAPRDYRLATLPGGAGQSPNAR